MGFVYKNVLIINKRVICSCSCFLFSWLATNILLSLTKFWWMKINGWLAHSVVVYFFFHISYLFFNFSLLIMLILFLLNKNILTISEKTKSKQKVMTNTNKDLWLHCKWVKKKKKENHIQYRYCHLF